MNEYNSTSSGKQPSSEDQAERRKGAKADKASERDAAEARPREYGGRKKGLDPTRYGDWEKDGRCIDF